jgi:choline dehydrogenase-like flavoprotein
LKGFFMKIDGREVEAGKIFEADICIAGAGAAGISLAREFIGKKQSVILLESGGYEYEDPTQDLYNGNTESNILGSRDKKTYLRSSRLRQLGGTTNHWAGWCRELDPLDFKKRDWVPHSGWPIQKKDLDPFYRRAAAVCEIAPFGYDWKNKFRHSFRHVSIGDEKDIETRIFHYSSPTRFGSVYRSELESSENVTLFLYSNATHLQVSANGKKVNLLKVQALGRNPFFIRAKHYVLSSGGVENVRLLMNSDDVHENGIGNENDVLGRCFMEHPHIPDAAHLFFSKYDDLSHYTGRPLMWTLDRTRVRGVFVPTDSFQVRRKTLSFSAEIRKISNLSDESEQMQEVVTQMDHLKGFFGRGLVSNFSKMRAQAYSFFIRSEQAPNWDSRVRLAKETCALGMRRVSLDWHTIDLDKYTLQVAFEAFGRALGMEGRGRVKTLVKAGEPWKSGSRGGRHHMGTTRMHDDPKQGVVDKNLRVHGIENLYVTGSSVFTTGGLANPTLSIVAFSLRLADHLKAKGV